MTRALVLAVAVLGAALVAQSWRLSRAADDLAAAREKVAAYQEAARIMSAHVARQDAARAAGAAVDRELQEGVGADAPLSDYLRFGAGRVWR